MNADKTDKPNKTKVDLKAVEKQMIEWGLQPDLSKTPAPHLHDDDEQE